MTTTLRALGAGISGLAMLGVMLLAAPASAELPPCENGFPPMGATECIDNGDHVEVGTGDEFGLFTGIPSAFIAFFILVVLVGVAVTIWRVHTARALARQAGMDPNIATGMTLLDEDGLSATYLASNLRTAMPGLAPASGPDPGPESTADRLTELKGLLDRGLITQVEYDAQRAEIIDSV